MTPWVYIPQLLSSGITIGAIYALVGLGFVTISRASQIINFAQGEFVMLAQLPQSPDRNPLLTGG